MSKEWVTADLHLGNHNVIEYCNRPYNHSRHMDADLIRNINETVDENDDLYMLGDFSLLSKSHRGQYEMWLNKIKCKRKHLIIGNHDMFEPRYYNEIGFFSIHYPYLELHEFVLVHDPSLSIVDKSRIFLCGHVHDLFKFQKNCINVGVDCWDYKPVNIEEIRKIISEYSTMKISGDKREISFPLLGDK